MSKAKVVYQIMLYFLAVAIFVFGHIYCVLKQPKIDDGQASSSILSSDPEVDELGFFVGGPCDVWDGTSEEPTLRDTTQNNSESNPYIIDTAEKLAWISDNYIEASTKYYLQTVNIDLDNLPWTTINPLRGTEIMRDYMYDGNNHIIYNLNCVDEYSNANPVGLFGTLGGSSATYVKNLMINGAYCSSTATSSNAHAAAVVSALRRGTIENCHVVDCYLYVAAPTGVQCAGAICSYTNVGVTIRNCSARNVEIEVLAGRGSLCGGVLGRIYSTTVENCVNYSDISVANTTTLSVGGIYGDGNNNSITNCANYGSIYADITGSTTPNVGGIVGNPGGNTTISQCVNYGYIEGHCGRGVNAGGIVGYGASNYVVRECVNYGNVFANAQHNEGLAGGIVGSSNCLDMEESLITKCINHGHILGTERTGSTHPAAGGIVGYIRGTNADSRAVVSYCYSTGSIAVMPDNIITYCGGVIGGFWNGYVTVDHCYYDYATVAAGPWTQTVTYLSTENNLIYLYGDPITNVVMTNCSPLSTAQMWSAEDGVAPSGMTGFTAENWVFQKNDYPKLNVGYRPESGLEAGATETELVYNAAAQTPQIKSSSYGNSEFSDAKPKSVWDGESVAIPLLKNTALANTETNPYLIDSAAKLAYLSAHPDWGNNKYVKQTVNIDLNWHKWTPINDVAVNRCFYYDGGNSIIYNLKIDETTKRYGGLFGYVVSGSIKNLLINGSEVVFNNVSIGAEVCYGTIVGRAVGLTLFNCHTKNGSTKTTTNFATYIGGIMGYGWSVTINNCSNDCAVWCNDNYDNGLNDVGGIYGSLIIGSVDNVVNYGSVFGYSRTITYRDGLIIAGIGGWNSGVEITRATNYGDVSIDSTCNCQMGGIGGNFGARYDSGAGASYNAKLEYCQNFGNITAISTSILKYNHVGGLIGWAGSPSLNNGSATLTLNCLINHGAVYSKCGILSLCGGIIGGSGAILATNCLNFGSVRQNLEDNTVSRTGGIIGGVMNSGTIVSATNCYYNITTMGNNADLYDGLSYTNISRGCGNLSSVVGNGLTTGQMLVKTTGTSPVCMTLSGEWKYVEGEYPTFKEAMTGGAFKYFEVDQNILTSEPISYWDGKSVENFTEGSGTSTSDPYIIDSAAKLAYLSKNYQSLSGKYFKQTIDIDLNNHLWTPIAPYDYPGNFNYKYEGNYHTIYNLYVDIDDPNGWSVCAGLFGKLGNNGYIKNLTLNGGSIHAIGTGNNKVCCGAFAGYMYSTGGVIENCHNINVSVFAEKGSSSYYTQMGGIVGLAVGAQILNCTNRSDIDTFKAEQTAAVHAGGIVGNLQGNNSTQAVVSGCINHGNIYNTNDYFIYENVGGIAGSLSYVNVTNCINYGSITIVGKAFDCFGGMIGISNNTLNLNNVKNYGTVYIADINSTANRQRFVGGIIGKISTSGATVTLTSIENIGDVYLYGNVLSGNKNATMPGGIIGVSYANTTANGIINRGSVIAYSETNNLGSPSNYVRVGSFAAIQNSSALVVNDFMNTGSVWSTKLYYQVTTYSIVTPKVVSGWMDDYLVVEDANTAGILLGNVENSASVTFRRCYWDSQKISSNLKCFIRGTFLSNTGSNFMAFSLDVYSPTGTVGGGSASQTSCVGVTTANLSVSTAGSAPSGASDLSSTYFDFSTVGTYPTLKASLTLSCPAYEKKCKVQNITSSRSVWDGTTSEKPTGEGTKINPYKIASAANLYWLALYPNLGHNKYFVQTVDIDLAMHDWTPINEASGNYTYYYDGNYHTIYNLYMNKTFTAYDTYVVFRVGLFGFLYTGSVLKNLSLNGGSVTATSQYGGSSENDFAFIMGTMVSGATGSTLHNLHNIGVNINLCNNGHDNAWTRCGGLIGQVTDNTIITNVSNSGSFYLECHAWEWTENGGIVGLLNNNCVLSNGYNSGEIKVYAPETAGFLGGIVGSARVNSIVEKCVNVGKVEAKSATSNSFTGGIMSLLNTGSIIRNCVNYGLVNCRGNGANGADSYSAGIIAWINQTSLDTYQAPQVEYCINYGIITNDYDDASYDYSVGAIVSRIQGYGVVENCYYNTDLANLVDGVQMCSKAVAWANTGSSVDSQTVKGLTTAQMTCSADRTLPAALVGFDSNIWKCYNSFMPTVVAGNYGVTYKNNVHAGTATALVIFDERSGFVGTKEASFTIVQAINSWVRNPAIAGWTYTNWPATPVGQALFGTVSFSYLDANDNPVTVSSSSNAGNYKLVAEVLGTDDYTTLRVVREFTISPLNFSSLVQIDLSGTSFVYDGQSHTPTETVTKTT